ncbi:MAG TPA: long-chain fatty acid--CoA ligase [Chthonomonadales bacterium]|nr:long-chain fatty acid--CoA ligase [Chthonomonadales bacterium]
MNSCNTIYGMLRDTVARYPDQRAVGYRSGKNQDATYWTYRDLQRKVLECRKGLDCLGLRRGDRIALLSENRAEWALVDLAAQALGLINVAIYPSLPAEQVEFILKDSGARAALVSDARQRSKVESGLRGSLEFLITLEQDFEASEEVRTLEGVIQLGRDRGRSEEALDEASEAVEPDDVATAIYTSGTTGVPKGAMLTHRNLLHTAQAVLAEPIADIGPRDVFLSFLPLSHITERCGGYYLPLLAGSCIVYSQGLAAFAEELSVTVQPTLMLCVPRLFESMHSKVLDRIAAMEPRQQRLVRWCIDAGEACARSTSLGKAVSPPAALRRMVAEKLALARLRTRVVGGNMRYMVSGGAPLDPATATFFLAIGVQILEGYGLSETGIIAVNRPHRQRIGTVGRLLSEVELKIAEDGEILTRGPGRMRGYFNNPEATEEAIDPEGWFHTGDVGEQSKDGFLKITDRKKDILVLANGKKVAPQPIEALLKHSSYISEAVLFGDCSPTVSALLAPAMDPLKRWAKDQGIEETDPEALIARPEVMKLFREEIDRNAGHLADFERIKRFKLVPHPFSIEGGELTPTLKVKRRFVAEKYAELLASISR